MTVVDSNLGPRDYEVVRRFPAERDTFSSDIRETAFNTDSNITIGTQTYGIHYSFLANSTASTKPLTVSFVV